MIWFVLASLIPVVMLALACLLGGVWPVVALISVTGLVYGMDRLCRKKTPAREDADLAATRLCVALGLAHFLLLPLGVWSIASASYLSMGQAFVTALALGLFFGQVSNANAHELIHKQNRWLRRLGKAIYISLLFGHHASAHPLVHHVWVASDHDPNSARMGEGFYQFWPRAWIGSFRAGMTAETHMMQRRAASVPRLGHPYVGYGIGALFTLVCAFGLAGWAGVLVLLGLVIYAQMQLMLSDYVQHYGLRRDVRPDGSLEPVGPQHAWNASRWYSSAMMLNAPRHSDHHVNPARSFPALRLQAETMPMLPSSFPVMSMAALCPPVWRRIMDHRVVQWSRDRTCGVDPANLPMSGDVETCIDSDVPAAPAGTGRNPDERRGV